ncbi:RagB/SusD family nutrient uptake outer membrane protein [Bacteroides sp. Marseille-P3684]|uniref:RagB/SusD family nutrient uptake outer membrane protein n=1 Tax=Bacteroides sp. Marseille-P3684 TaxID=2086579 RepID=UPI000D0AF26D|nr:RagB/SusD family nutrient uptake outer membrane protein [Bacteroides sp. Marseille-P3684]
MKKIIYMSFLLMFAALSACSNLLEESSQDLLIPKSVKDYKELFFGEVMKNGEVLHPYLEYMTDDVADQCYYGSFPILISNDWREAVWSYYTWQQSPEIGKSNEFTADVAWSSYFHKILMTNIILDEIHNMNGTEEERIDLAGEAYFMRAFSYFMLANLYGCPYDPATADKDLCVPINDEISLSDKMMQRATNAVVYARMESDVLHAIQCFKKSGNKKSIFRPNLVGAYLLASRIFLFQKNYPQTILYSDSVIRNVPQGLNRLTEEENNNIFLSYSNKEIIFSYGTTTLESYMQTDFTYKGNLTASSDLIALYDEADLRLSHYFHHTKGNQRKPVKKEIEFYTPAKWSRTSPTVYSNAFRLSEAYLNRAEAYAELGNTEAALADINTLRDHRMKAGTSQLTVDNDGIVAAVRKERRRELAFEGFRWFDLRRYGCPSLEHTYSSSETEGAGDKFKLDDKELYTLPIPKSERDRNTMIETFNRPVNDPIK